MDQTQTGNISWFDLTVPDAAKVKDFYAGVTGWKAAEFDMGGYSDYVMNPPSDGKAVAGVCWSRGVNAALPPVWLIYINVDNLDVAIGRCLELGGTIRTEPAVMDGYGRYCVIQDPAGAVAALFEASPPAS